MRIAVWADQAAWAENILSLEDVTLDESEEKQTKKLVAGAKEFLLQIAKLPDGDSRDRAIQSVRLALFYGTSAVVGKGHV